MRHWAGNNQPLLYTMKFNCSRAYHSHQPCVASGTANVTQLANGNLQMILKNHEKGAKVVQDRKLEGVVKNVTIKLTKLVMETTKQTDHKHLNSK